MTAPRDLDRELTDFLREGPDELPEVSFAAVRDRTEQTRQRVVIGPWRLPEMYKILTVGLGATAVVAVLLVGTQLFGERSGNVGGRPTATPEPITPEPTPQGLLPEGSHTLWDRQGARVQVTVNIPAPDWYGEPGDGTLQKDDDSDAPDGAGLFVFAGSSRLLSQDLYVYGDPCHWRTTRPDAPVTTVEEVVTALASQPSRDASRPTDVTVGGHTGKLIVLRVPENAVFSDCDQGEFRTLVQEYEDGSGGEARHAQDPGQFEKLWVLDVNGALVLIGAGYYAETPQSVLDELDAIMESATLTSPEG